MTVDECHKVLTMLNLSRCFGKCGHILTVGGLRLEDA